jgi:two-component system KDP operon response regulator KdpE
VTRVLVVDDEPQIIRALRITLRARGYEVVTAATGADALRVAADRHPDVVLLDLGLPDLDGVQVVRRLRERTDVPVLVLSGRLQSVAKVQALDAGADDYVTKPFDIEELLARVRALTRRAADAALAEPVRVGRWLIDLADRRVTDGEGDVDPVHLTPTEWHLLDLLLASPGRLVSQRRLLQRVWGPAYVGETHYLRQYMKNLRRKLEPEPARPRHLLTEPGLGYRFQP